MSIDFYDRSMKIHEYIGVSTFKVGIHLGVLRVHSLTSFYILKNMEYSSASLSTHNFTSFYFDHASKICNHN